MKRQRIIIIASYFLIFIFLAQMLSFSMNDCFGLLNHAENSKPTPTSITGTVHTDALIIRQENRKSFFKISAQKFQCAFTFEVNNPGFSQQSFLNKRILIDIRSKIACIMSNYFHSAKYKDSNSII